MLGFELHCFPFRPLGLLEGNLLHTNIAIVERQRTAPIIFGSILEGGRCAGKQQPKTDVIILVRNDKITLFPFRQVMNTPMQQHKNDKHHAT